MDIALTIFLILSCSSSVFLLDIRLPPDIIHGPAVEYFVKFEKSVTLPCISTGTPDATIIWKFMWNSTLKIATDIRTDYAILSNGSLFIKNLQQEDVDGTYRCIAKNIFGETMSNVTSLIEAFYGSKDRSRGNPLQPTFIIPPEKYYFVLSCDIIRSFSLPKAIIKWTFSPNISSPQYTMLKNTQHRMVNNKGSLWIPHIRQADTGKYCCGEYNSELDLFNREECIDVVLLGSEPEDFAPIITEASTPSKETVYLGEPYKMQCLFFGKPDPDVTWTHIPKIGNWRLDNFGTSLISNDVVYFSDSGTYTCVGSNGIGPNATHSIQLNVIAGPKPAFGEFVDKPYSRNVTEGDPPEKINCKAVSISNDNITTKWYKNTKPLNLSANPDPNLEMSNDSTTLTVYNLTKEFSLMSVQCKASNENGSIFAQGYLNVLARTRIENDGPCDHYLSKDVFFDCPAISDDSTPVNVTWYFKNSPLNQGGGYKIYPNFTLHINTSGDSDGGVSRVGKYTCQATNGYSISYMTCNLDISVATAGIEWWVGLLVALFIILLILLIFLIFCCCCRQGESYPVDKNERKNGNDPVNDLQDADFHHATNVSNDRDNLITPNVMSGYGVVARDFSYPAYHDEVSNYPNNSNEANGFPYDPMNDSGNGDDNGNDYPYSTIGNRDNQVTLV